MNVCKYTSQELGLEISQKTNSVTNKNYRKVLIKCMCLNLSCNQGCCDFYLKTTIHYIFKLSIYGTTTFLVLLEFIDFAHYHHFEYMHLVLKINKKLYLPCLFLFPVNTFEFHNIQRKDLRSHNRCITTLFFSRLRNII